MDEAAYFEKWSKLFQFDIGNDTNLIAFYVGITAFIPLILLTEYYRACKGGALA